MQVGLLEIVFIANTLDYVGKQSTNISYMNELFGSIWIIALLFTASSL